MAAELSLGQQLDTLITRIRAEVPGLKSVVGMEDLDDAMQTDELLPAAVVIWSGDYPAKFDGGNQTVKRYWSVILVLDLQRDPLDALDLVQEVSDACKGFWLCPGVGKLTLAGSRFVSKFDNTRVTYEVRFVGDAWELYNP